jgi:PST family polysaccharide transporter
MSLLKNATWLLAEKSLRIAVGFVVNLAVIRHLGPEDFGRYAYAMSLVFLAMPAARAGLEALVVRELSLAGTGATRGTLRFAAIRLAAGALVVAALISCASVLAPEPSSRLLVVVASGMLLLQAADVFEFWAQSHSLAWRTAALRIGVIAAGALARVALIAADADTIAFVVVVLAESLASGACAFSLWWRHAKASGGGTAYSRPVPWAQARSVLLNSLIATIYLRIDAPMLVWLAGPEQAGLHAAAMPFVDALGIVPMVMGVVLLPELTRLWAEGEAARERFWAELESAMVLATWAGLGAATALAVFAVAGLGWVLGERFATTVPVVLILCTTVPVLFQGSIMDMYVFADARMRWLLAKSAAVLALKLALAAWWIPEYGALGAAASSAAAVWVAAYLVTWAMSARLLAVALRAYSPSRFLASIRRLARRVARST